MLVSINLLVPTTFLSHHPESFLVCSRSTPLIHFLRTIPSVSSHLHFRTSLWIFLSLSPSPLHNFSVEVPSQVYTIYPVFFSLRLHLFTVCHYFPPFIAYMNFSFRASFFFSLFFSLFFDPQFHPCYYSLGSSSLFLSFFLPLDITICTLSVEAFPFVLLFRFPSTFLLTFSLYLFSPVRLLFFSLSSSKNVYSVSSLSYPR
jgi:hypothetical protein